MTREGEMYRSLANVLRVQGILVWTFAKIKLIEYHKEQLRNLALGN